MSNLAKYLNYNHAEDIKNTLNGFNLILAQMRIVLFLNLKPS